jgi:cyclopropane fatty-acyl-phospholipid synthase-like methyltransferase
MRSGYDREFYKSRHEKTLHSANAILSIVFDVLPKINTAVDFGCGVGTWLSVLKEKGTNDILGLDGPWVEKDLLEIPKDNFREIDFESGIRLEKRYDLAISLEVAEHLKSETAEKFVNTITDASDYVLFSAAIPNQGGTDHINEQWQDYWAELFLKRGYIAFDLIRKKIWNDKTIPFWYRQNILIYAKKEKADELRISDYDRLNSQLQICIVHPESYEYTLNKMSSLKGSIRLLRRAVIRSFKRYLKL